MLQGVVRNYSGNYSQRPDFEESSQHLDFSETSYHPASFLLLQKISDTKFLDELHGQLSHILYKKRQQL